MPTTSEILSLLVYVSFVLTRSNCTISSVTLPNQEKPQSAYIPSLNTAYTFGGSNSVNVYKYDLSSSQGFTQIGTTPDTTFWSHGDGVAIIDNLVYFIGMDKIDYVAIHIFDTDTDSWLNTNNIASPPSSPMDACVVNNQTHIFAVGGRHQDVDTLQIYDINKNSWTQSTINIAAVTAEPYYWGQMCSMVNDVLYVFGGYLGAGWDTDTNNIYKWQEGSGWSSVGTLPQIISEARAAKHPLDNNILIIGGFPSTDTIYKFNVETETITDTYHLVKAISGFAADFVGDVLYIWGSESYPTEIQICTGFVDIITSNPTTTPSTKAPSAQPTKIPTKAPSEQPTKIPIKAPSEIPSEIPSKAPSKIPNKLSTETPSNMASEEPSNVPEERVEATTNLVAMSPIKSTSFIQEVNKPITSTRYPLDSEEEPAAPGLLPVGALLYVYVVATVFAGICGIAAIAYWIWVALKSKASKEDAKQVEIRMKSVLKPPLPPPPLAALGTTAISKIEEESSSSAASKLFDTVTAVTTTKQLETKRTQRTPSKKKGEDSYDDMYDPYEDMYNRKQTKARTATNTKKQQTQKATNTQTANITKNTKKEK